MVNERCVGIDFFRQNLLGYRSAKVVNHEMRMLSRFNTVSCVVRPGFILHHGAEKRPVCEVGFWRKL
jgi:hypothetical protein